MRDVVEVDSACQPPLDGVEPLVAVERSGLGLDAAAEDLAAERDELEHEYRP